jgi:hypothetical protein
MDEPDIATMEAEEADKFYVADLAAQTDKGLVTWQPHEHVGWTGEWKREHIVERVTPDGSFWRFPQTHIVEHVPYSACPNDFADLHEAILRSILNDNSN